MDHGPGRRRFGHHPRRRQHDHHRRVHARTRHDDVPDARIHLEHPADQLPGVAGLSAADLRAVRAGRRPPPRRAHLRPRQRWGDPVAAPVLVLRPPRGLHRRAAVLRHRHRDLAGVFPQTAVRLHDYHLCHFRDQFPFRGGVGAPHVRHRRRTPAVLQLHVLSDRRPDRDQVLQLDRHHVARPS